MVIKNRGITRLVIFPGLVISFLVFFSACTFKEDKSNDKPTISLLWEGQKAVGISIPKNLTNTVESKTISVRLAGAGEQPIILGNYDIQEGNVLFRPLIPFTPGLSYHIFVDTVFMGVVTIPQPDNREKPVLLSIYPTSDTLPENLLKMYLQFSKPMRAGNSLQHITLVNAHNDTLPAPFLALQPELWNKEGTLLTLWLDPGRIKKDLQPNKAMGPPLGEGENITMIVAPTWKDREGAPLDQKYTKHFYVTTSDRKSPIPNTWHVSAPEGGTQQPLEISFGEPLDYALLQETIGIQGEEGESVSGSISLKEGERKLYFIPNASWIKGSYYIVIASRLEDLAGNNLSRPFEVDNFHYPSGAEQEFFEVKFEVR
jgi:hypothetical protein